MRPSPDSVRTALPVLLMLLLMSGKTAADPFEGLWHGGGETYPAFEARAGCQYVPRYLSKMRLERLREGRYTGWLVQEQVEVLYAGDTADCARPGAQQPWYVHQVKHWQLSAKADSRGRLRVHAHSGECGNVGVYCDPRPGLAWKTGAEDFDTILELDGEYLVDTFMTPDKEDNVWMVREPRAEALADSATRLVRAHLRSAREGSWNDWWRMLHPSSRQQASRDALRAHFQSVSKAMQRAEASAPQFLMARFMSFDKNDSILVLARMPTATGRDIAALYIVAPDAQGELKATFATLR